MTDAATTDPAHEVDLGGEHDAPPVSRRRTIGRVLLVVGLLGFAAFWIWALFFASREPVNRIDDVAWRERAERICVAAEGDRLQLADFREMNEATPELVGERADIVDRATDILERMLDDVVAVQPTDAKGAAVIPLWEADYRTYLQDRRDYTETLRTTGENSPFYETEVSGLPISEKLETFAADNHMPSCAPPRDLTR
jgi:hypothetical protein